MKNKEKKVELIHCTTRKTYHKPQRLSPKEVIQREEDNTQKKACRRASGKTQQRVFGSLPITKHNTLNIRHHRHIPLPTSFFFEKIQAKWKVRLPNHRLTYTSKEDTMMVGKQKEPMRKRQHKTQNKYLCVACQQRRAICKTPKGYRFLPDHRLCYSCYESVMSSAFAKQKSSSPNNNK